jgi:hypothetical protein
MGRVTSREAQRASEIARSGSVSGVVKVVRVFEIITEEELKAHQRSTLFFTSQAIKQTAIEKGALIKEPPCEKCPDV